MTWEKNKEVDFSVDANIIDSKIKEIVYNIGQLRVEQSELKSTSLRNNKDKVINNRLKVLKELKHKKESSKNTIIVFAGPSGCGKSFLEKLMLTNHPNKFHKLPQASTRKRRHPDEDSYVFLQKKTFRLITDILIGKTTHNGDSYGTFPDFKMGYMNTIILSKEGLLDLYESLKNENIHANVMVLGIDATMDILPDDAKRDGRDSNFLEKEREVLDYAHFIFKRKSSTHYPSEKSVIELINKNL